MVTEVAFHFNAPDRIGYACRLLRKVVATGAHAVVSAEPERLRELDLALWTFGAREFVPHCLIAGSDPELIAATPVLLGAPLDAPRHEVLVNLGDAVPDGFERYARLIEVVTSEAADRTAARQRWRHYAEHGYALQRHDVAGTGRDRMA